MTDETAEVIRFETRHFEDSVGRKVKMLVNLETNEQVFIGILSVDSPQGPATLTFRIEAKGPCQALKHFDEELKKRKAEAERKIVVPDVPTTQVVNAVADASQEKRGLRLIQGGK